jgi:Zn-finger nucleic acid-binding protein
LYRYHIIHQCQRCKGVFESEAELESHIEISESCDATMATPIDGVTRKMKVALQSKKKAFKGQKEAERWMQVYQILFPEEEEIPDPCKF